LLKKEASELSVNELNIGFGAIGGIGIQWRIEIPESHDQNQVDQKIQD
jgi:hypothetical protein